MVEFGLPVELAEFFRLLRDNRQTGIGGIRRQARDLLRIGQRHHQLIGAEIERGHAARRIGGARQPGKNQHENSARQSGNGILNVMRA